ncbi:DEAD/DEAH box helicase [Saccharicrinis sp. GN24d3]|uniref:DEAD/DEAH box helicase n=1 Tax=Saccharicrinis sp. GN24d3 TaxID=3458416 RepID=UPI004035748B
MQHYINLIQELKDPTFQQIRQIAADSISHLPKPERDELWRQLNHGVDLLDSHELMCQYLFSYGNMHEGKIHDALNGLADDVFFGNIEIVDWGCGQGMATLAFFDFVSANNKKTKVNKVTLIEPSEKALERAALHVNSYVNDFNKIRAINKYLDEVDHEDIQSDGNHPVIHLFSNILDIKQIDLKLLSEKVDNSVLGDNYIICVGPLNYGNRRIDAFHDYFDVPALYEKNESQFNYGGSNTCTCNIKVFQLKYTGEGHLIPIEFYPSVQFHGAYQLDCIGTLRKRLDENKQKRINEFYQKLTCFETATPFDIGASVYDDVHPLLAVLNNMVTRGLPTKASPFIESQFEQAFGMTQREDRPNGDITFSLHDDFDYLYVLNWIRKQLKNNYIPDYSDIDIVQAQMVLSPIAIARIQKTILEAVMTDQLDIEKNTWRILVEEKDVPCAAIAFKDLELLYNNLASLSQLYQDMDFPNIELDIVSPIEFCQSPLHLGNKVYTDSSELDNNTRYDLVIDMSVLQYSSIEKDSFSTFKCRNQCYFNVQPAQTKRSKRTIYTSDKIEYRDLVFKDSRGDYTDITESKELLEFFLQLLFRKKDFRPGQLPILHRALQNNCVIGLLPTGGGKSLTYQLAAMLQPGVTLIVDPLSSLMKDQYDGLVRAGIDCCTYINSTVSDKEHRAMQMERSELLFVFLSPERLGIYNFRERLKLMHETHVYFAYGVLDEVHCVSEWGHDFRFSYLHMGRNIYQYVKAKEGNVSLFGLTATASFDVLADVERELSGEGAFDLDADTIVRYENTNRLELQYRVEKVNVEYELDPFYKYGLLDSGLPKAVNLFAPKSSQAINESKSKVLSEYIKKVPKYLNELQSEDALKTIQHAFAERQNIQLQEFDLTVEMPNKYFDKNKEYKQAGIVFCPHKANTGISVLANKKALESDIKDIGSFFGGDDGDSSMKNLELFRNNQQAIMVATKAFGMGIDKPNVRFTINMNYSSSLESFVQEAGRAGRDQKMALSTILVSNYKLARINKNFPILDFPLKHIKNHWFYPEDLQTICNHYKLSIDSEYIDYCTPESDIVQVNCSVRKKVEDEEIYIFAKKKCKDLCHEYEKCDASRVPDNARGWHYLKDLQEKLAKDNLDVRKKNIQYQNTDYETVMYFYNNSFKGAIIEKEFMNDILSLKTIDMFFGNDMEMKSVKKVKGFLSSLLAAKVGEEIVSFIPYVDEDKEKGIEGDSIDVAKAIYRMTCIGLIEDFTQDYKNGHYRIVSVRKEEGGYYKGLNRFLLRYYNTDRSALELEKAKGFNIKEDPDYPVKNEINRCLEYLIEFIYDKISEKRKRAIDDMRNFCIAGIDESKDWKDRNEELKDFIYYYFNSKYAKEDYIADNGEEYSLTMDTDRGKESSAHILFKYMKVINDELVGASVPIDNVKHLQGAVRLIRRSLTDSNPALSLLNAFCLFYLGTNNNDILVEELTNSYKDGVMEFEKRTEDKLAFWDLFEVYNSILEPISTDKTFLLQLKSEVSLAIHANKISNIATKYTL